jgi:hypothetical protein
MQGIPVFKKEGNKKILVSTWYEEKEKKEKKVRLFIDEEEIDVKTPEREETSPFDGASVVGVAGNFACGNSKIEACHEDKVVEYGRTKSPTLAMELKMMREEKKNRFALLTSEDSDEEDNYKTPLRKSFAKMVVPDAPIRVRTQEAHKTGLKPEKLCFDEKKTYMSVGAWKKPLSETIEEKYGDMETWKKARVKSFEEVVEVRKEVMKKELAEMQEEYKKLKEELDEKKEKEETKVELVKETKIVSWADMMEFE